MNTKGIRILDKDDRGVVTVELPDILKEIHNPNLLHWSILFLYLNGSEELEMPVETLEEQIKESENGLLFTWDELNSLSKKFHQILDVVLIGSRNENLLHRYKSDQEMYEACDIVIVMFDSTFWEVFSKDGELINRFAEKFKDIQFLTPDFQTRTYRLNDDISHTDALDRQLETDNESNDKCDQAAFNKAGKIVDNKKFIDQCRPRIPNPHQHKYHTNSKGGAPYRGIAEPL